MIKLAFCLLVAAAACAIATLAGSSALAGVLSVGLLLASAEVFTLTRLARGFSPILIPVLTVNGVFLSAPLLWERVQAQATTSFKIAASEESLIAAATIGIVFCAAFSFGAVLAGPRKMVLSLTDAATAVTKIPAGALVAVGYGAIGLAVFAWQGALLEGRYLEARGPVWAVVASSAVGIPVAVLSLSMVAGRGGQWRMFALVGLFVASVILFARASRSVALLPGLVLLGWAIGSQRAIRGRSIAVAGVTTLLLLQFSLLGRANPDGVGILPLAQLLSTQSGDIFMGLSVAAVFGNFLVSAPQTALVASQPIADHVFWTSVNPLPSQFTDWDRVRESLMLNAYTPFNTLGELAAHGWAHLVLASSAAGFLMAVSTRIASGLRGGFQISASLLILAATTYFSLSILQYNLRSSARLVWYVFLGVTMLWFAALTMTRRSAESVAVRNEVGAKGSRVNRSGQLVVPGDGMPQK